MGVFAYREGVRQDYARSLAAGSRNQARSAPVRSLLRGPNAERDRLYAQPAAVGDFRGPRDTWRRHLTDVPFTD